MDLCSICHEHFDKTSLIVIAKHTSDKTLDDSRKRGHYFHRACLEMWKKHCSVVYDSHDLPVGFICPMDRDEICRLYTVPNYELIGFDMRYYDSDMLRVLNECRRNRNFLQQITDIDETDRRNKTLAYYACYLGDYQLVCRLIGAGADFNKHGGDHGFTPLMAAVCQNHYNIVSKLLANRKTRQHCCTVIDRSGMNAFMYACKGCHDRIITEFLNNEIPTAHQVRYCLVIFSPEFRLDELYGRDIIHKLNHYLGNISPDKINV
jgi:hypothetical protein